MASDLENNEFAHYIVPLMNYVLLPGSNVILILFEVLHRCVRKHRSTVDKD